MRRVGRARSAGGLYCVQTVTGQARAVAPSFAAELAYRQAAVGPHVPRLDAVADEVMKEHDDVTDNFAVRHTPMPEKPRTTGQGVGSVRHRNKRN